MPRICVPFGHHSPTPLRQALVLACLVAALALAGCRAGDGASITVASQPTAAAPGLDTSATPSTTPGASATVEPTASASPTPTASRTATATTTATGTRTPAPTPARTPASTPTSAPLQPLPPGVVVVEPAAVGQGETLVIQVPGAPVGTTGTLRIGGLAYPLVASPRGLWAVIGIPIGASLGPAKATVALRDGTGKQLGEAAATYQVVAVDRPIDHLEVTPEVGAILTPEAGAKESAQRAQQFASFDSLPRWDRLFRAPLAGALEITTAFGQGRSINGGPVQDPHSGTDLAADEGTPVYAAAAGRVSWAGAMPIRGNSILLDHGAGVLTGYHHLHDIAVAAGQTVQTGDLIGHVGSTGFSTGPHLHWEVTIYGVNVDGMTWLTRLFGPPPAP